MQPLPLPKWALAADVSTWPNKVRALALSSDEPISFSGSLQPMAGYRRTGTLKGKVKTLASILQSLPTWLCSPCPTIISISFNNDDDKVFLKFMAQVLWELVHIKLSNKLP